MKNILLLFSGLSIFFLGTFVGILLENIRQSEQKKFSFQPQEKVEKNVPVLEIFAIENGEMKGKIKSGEVRIQLPKEEIFVGTSEKFSFSVLEILPMLKKIPAPSNAKFVASKRGKEMYPLDSPRAFLVTPKNRIFFETEEEAIAKGYFKYK